MNKCVLVVLIILNISFHDSATAQSQEVNQLLLDIKKLASLKNILVDLKKGFEIISNGYNSIKNISEGNFNLHQTFLNSLMQISPQVKKYHHVADIINDNLMIVTEYKTAFNKIKGSNLFSPEEITYMGKVYSNLFNQSTKSLDDLVTVLTANKLRMNDDERINAIDNVWAEVTNQLTFIRHFNDNTKVLALQRSKEQNDASAVNKLYDVNH